MNYAGIGSRETPADVVMKMVAIGFMLAKKGYTLRSGGAAGADAAFEKGCDGAKGQKEIFLPWLKFNNHPSVYCRVHDGAMELAQKYHPAWDKLTSAAKNLIARNGYQVLGPFLDNPVDFVVCWTKDGKASGGTGQAIRIAEDKGITVYNLYHNDQYEALLARIKTIGRDEDGISKGVSKGESR